MQNKDQESKQREVLNHAATYWLGLVYTPCVYSALYDECRPVFNFRWRNSYQSWSDRATELPVRVASSSQLRELHWASSVKR